MMISTNSTATNSTLLRHRIGGDLAFLVQVTDYPEGEDRLILDVEQNDARLGWIPAPLREIRGLCVDFDLPHLGLDRWELMRILAERLGTDDTRQPLDWDPPCYEMDDEGVDAWAASLGE